MAQGCSYDCRAGEAAGLNTRPPRHQPATCCRPSSARQVLERVWERGDIYKANYEGWYCVDCEEYKDEGDMDAGAAVTRV